MIQSRFTLYPDVKSGCTTSIGFRWQGRQMLFLYKTRNVPTERKRQFVNWLPMSRHLRDGEEILFEEKLIRERWFVETQTMGTPTMGTPTLGTKRGIEP
ncbi:hypothetical protein DRW42_26395 [Pedobacter miscanthi]|uniref:Uncharacterized protein n=1 Tax=Pedobacter miscanthi TaxID=2259170 RepID=A0A366KLV6_9SPHI|nr:hypothetical protein DRW42_26395 [Pedobacter miscanthi]